MKYRHIIKDGEIIARAIDASGYFMRLRGLIGRKISPEEGLLLKPCDQIHTFFMSYPIDVVYVSSSGCVLKVESSVRRGRICRRVKGCRCILELSSGAAAQLGIRERDELSVRFGGRRGAATSPEIRV